MKKRFLAGACAALAIAILVIQPTSPAQARDGFRGRGEGRFDRDGFRGDRFRDGARGSFSIWLGPVWDPWWWGPPWYPGSSYYPYYYPYPYYVTPPVVTQPPTTYDQQVQEPQEEQSYWYYCQDPPGYYPYVQQCPRGWKKVLPTTEPAPPAAAPQQPSAPSSQQPPSADTQQPGGPEARSPVPGEYRWYHCQDPEGYYPYVRECPKGWTKVAPVPSR